MRGSLVCLGLADLPPRRGYLPSRHRGLLAVRRGWRIAVQGVRAQHGNQHDRTDESAKDDPPPNGEPGVVNGGRPIALTIAAAEWNSVDPPRTQITARLAPLGVSAVEFVDVHSSCLLAWVHPRTSPFTGNSLGSCLASTVLGFAGRRRRTFAGGRWP